MPKLYIHLGAPKTGTSALQSAFASHTHQFLDHNVVYPHFRTLENASAGSVSSGNGVPLAKLLNPSHSARVETDHVYDQIREAFSGGHDILYSCEGIGRFRLEKMLEFREFAERVGYQLVPVVYVRAIADHAVSAYQQAVKSKLYSDSLVEFVRSRYSGTQTRLVKKIQHIFDWSNFIL